MMWNYNDKHDSCSDYWSHREVFWAPLAMCFHWRTVRWAMLCHIPHFLDHVNLSIKLVLFFPCFKFKRVLERVESASWSEITKTSTIVAVTIASREFARPSFVSGTFLSAPSDNIDLHLVQGSRRIYNLSGIFWLFSVRLDSVEVSNYAVKIYASSRENLWIFLYMPVRLFLKVSTSEAVLSSHSTISYITGRGFSRFHSNARRITIQWN